MTLNITEKERLHLRELAAKQTELANLPVMEERKKMWYNLNDGKKDAKPPVIIETWTFDKDFMPDSVYTCQSELGREIEYQILKNIRNHEFINDDKVMPNTFDIQWDVDIDDIGVPIVRGHAEDSDAGGYDFDHPITDLKRDIELLKPAVCSVDREKTYAKKAFLDDLFGDLLPVKIQSGTILGGTFGNTMLTQRVIELMGMEAFFMAMYDSADEVHALMKRISDNALQVMQWAEDEELLVLNNDNQCSFFSSYNFTEKLPAREIGDDRVRLSDMWGNANSQETVGVAPDMFKEFCAPYYHKVCEPMGLVYYGCCEPVNPVWDDVQTIPNLKKVSISRWCDEKFMGEALQNSNIVFSRKPDPGLIGVNEMLDEEAWSKCIKDTLDATPDTSVEFIVRDVYSVHGNLNKPKRAVELARQEINKKYN